MNKFTAFKWIANGEGISFLLLLGIAMPMKYLWEQPWLTRQLGMAHGVLFIGYVLAAIAWRKSFAWNARQTLIALLLSFVPFGTFYVSGRMMKRDSAL